MSTTGLSQLDHAVQITNVWLGELMQMMDWGDRARAYHALHAVLPALRTHLPVEETADLAAQLPLVIRAIFFEGWQPAREPNQDRSGQVFIDRIGKAFANTPGAHPAEIARAVFALLEHHVSAGEISDIRKALPEGVRRYWTEQPGPGRRLRL